MTAFEKESAKNLSEMMTLLLETATRVYQQSQSETVKQLMIDVSQLQQKWDLAYLE